MRIDRTIEVIGEDPKQSKEQIERKLRNYRKFQSKVNRLTEFAHTKRMMARMEYQVKKEQEEKKAKRAAGKHKTAA